MRREYTMQTIQAVLLPDGWHNVGAGTWDLDYLWDGNDGNESQLGFAFFDSTIRRSITGPLASLLAVRAQVLDETGTPIE